MPPLAVKVIVMLAEVPPPDALYVYPLTRVIVPQSLKLPGICATPAPVTCGSGGIRREGREHGRIATGDWSEAGVRGRDGAVKRCQVVEGVQPTNGGVPLDCDLFGPVVLKELMTRR
jgi:hypothetical protein